MPPRLAQDLPASRIVGAHIHALRTARGWSLREVGRLTEAAGKPVGYLTVGRIERGRDRARPAVAVIVDDLVALAAVFGLRPEQLLTAPDRCTHSFPDPYPQPIDQLGDCRDCGISYQEAKDAAAMTNPADELRAAAEELRPELSGREIILPSGAIISRALAGPLAQWLDEEADRRDASLVAAIQIWGNAEHPDAVAWLTTGLGKGSAHALATARQITGGQP